MSVSEYLERPLLLRGARHGCPICAAFVVFLGSATDENGILIVQSGNREPGDTNIPRRSHLALGGMVERRVFCTKEQPCPWGFFPFDKEIRSGSGPADSLRIISSWVGECVTGHKCGSTGPEQTLPSRVIRIGGLGDESVNLVETNGSKGRYVCLSHCWGTQHTFETMTSTLARFLKGFPLADMPPTYRDAVSITRMLGIRYLWIDSLCIIQDDRDDWRRESARMADVYSQAFLTLAATWGSSNSTGLFHKYGDVEALGISDAGVPYRILCRQKDLHPYFEAKEERNTRFPLLARGWVFQERLLSPRVLHFGSEELLWECQERVTCECGGTRDGLGLSKSRHSEAMAFGTERQLAFAWRKLIEEYSATRLSQPNDRLPALSGVAKQFQQRRKDSYLAGLWKSTLLEDMLWAVSRGHKPLQNAQPPEWRAPSWSWAAVDAEIEYPGYNYWTSYTVKSWYSRVEDIAYVAAGDDTGEAESGHITIHGPAIRGYCSPRITEDGLVYEISISGPWTETVFLFSTDSLTSRRNRIFFDRSAYHHDKTVVDPELANTEVVFLRILRMRLEQDGMYKAAEYILLLRRSEKMGFYERLGVAVIQDNTSYGTIVPDSKVWDKFASPFDGWKMSESVTIL